MADPLLQISIIKLTKKSHEYSADIFKDKSITLLCWDKIAEIAVSMNL